VEGAEQSEVRHRHDLAGQLGRARSLHFIGLVLFSGFIIMHVALVFVVHPEHNVVNMVFGGGEVTAARGAQGVVIMVSTIVAVIVFWIALSYWSLADRARAQRF